MPTQESKMTVLYVGLAKTGKTHNAISWPRAKIISFDPNLAVLDKFNADYQRCQDWRKFKMDLLPKIVSREWDCDTIVVDSISVANDACIQAAKTQGLKGFDLWGWVYESFMSAMNDLIEVANPHPLGDRRSYNVVCTCHEQMITDDKGNLLRITLKMGGQSKDSTAQLFNTVLNCQTELESKISGGEVKRMPSYFVWTVPPDSYRIAGDGVGGGKYKVLPSRLTGTYPSLAAAWGLPQRSET